MTREHIMILLILIEMGIVSSITVTKTLVIILMKKR